MPKKIATSKARVTKSSKKRAISKTKTSKKSSAGIRFVVTQDSVTTKKIITPQAPSRHVINLKELAHQQEITQKKKDHYTDYLKEQTLQKIEGTKHDFQHLKEKAFKKLTYTKPQQKKQPLYHPTTTHLISASDDSIDFIREAIEKAKKKEVKRTRRPIQLPTLPKITLPKLMLPTITLPTLRLPQLRFVSQLNLTPYAQRAIATFVLASFILTSPLLAFDYYKQLESKKGRVLGATHEAITHLKNGSPEDLATATDSLSQAHESFQLASNELESLSPVVRLILKTLPQEAEYSTGKELLLVAEKTTLLGKNILHILNNESEESLGEQLTALIRILSEKKHDILKISGSLQTINMEVIPEEYQATLTSIKALLPILESSLNELEYYSSFILELLGIDRPQTYLILFQNNNELRATGGFIGSFSELTLHKGKITSLTIPQGGSYDLEAGLRVNVTPPKPIQVLNERWEFQDANYFPDFAKSAQKALWLYQQSGGPTVDGVLALNATYMQELLSLTGDIYLPEYDAIITAENFVEFAEFQAELGEDKENNTPKRLIDILTPHVLEKLISFESFSLHELITTIQKGMITRDIQVYFTNPDQQALASDQRWTGELLPTSGDYLSIVTTNIAGGKTDLSLKDSVDVQVTINDNGTIDNTITLTRTHQGDPQSPLYGVKHNDYIRFYVPLGSQLIETQGFEPLDDSLFRKESYVTDADFDLALEESTKKTIPGTKTDVFQDDNHTVFANWIQTSVGETQVVKLTYRLPFTLFDQQELLPVTNFRSFLQREFSEPKKSFEKYSLLIQKQSGKQTPSYKITVTTPPSQSFVWAYPSQLQVSGNTYVYEQNDITNDLFLGIIFDKN